MPLQQLNCKSECTCTNAVLKLIYTSNDSAVINKTSSIYHSLHYLILDVQLLGL